MPKVRAKGGVSKSRKVAAYDRALDIRRRLTRGQSPGQIRSALKLNEKQWDYSMGLLNVEHSEDIENIWRMFKIQMSQELHEYGELQDSSEDEKTILGCIKGRVEVYDKLLNRAAQLGLIGKEDQDDFESKLAAMARGVIEARYRVEKQEQTAANELTAKKLNGNGLGNGKALLIDVDEDDSSGLHS